MAMAAMAYHRKFLEEHLHQESMFRLSPFWAEDIPFQEKVVSKHPWDATDETPEITGVPPDILLLVEMESMQQKIEDLKTDLQASFKSTLAQELDDRNVGGPGYARGNDILAKMDTLLDKLTQVSSAVQASPAVPALPPHDPADLGDSGEFVSDDEEEDIGLMLDEPEQMPPRKRARIIRERTKEQLANRKIKVGFHHGQFNPLPASWKFPKGLTVIQLAGLWLVGSEKEHIPPLGTMPTQLLKHIDKKGKIRSMMNVLMKELEYFARREGVWLEKRWTVPDVTKMWSTIWSHIDPYLRTKTVRRDGTVSHAKSRQGQLSWRTCYNNLMKEGKNWLPSNRLGRAREIPAGVLETGPAVGPFEA